jgi:Protein of unknown function (DUF664)
MPDRRTPFVNLGERDTLVAFLDYLRDGMVAKVTGLSEEDARRALVPSGTTVLGLVKHVTRVEVLWFQWSFAGLAVHIPSDRLTDDDRIDTAVAAYRAVCARSNEIVGAVSDPAAMCARGPGDIDPLPLRWVLVHLVEETARHAGHADILREQLDGETGR